MNRALVLILLFFLVSCDEGLRIAPEDVDAWRIENKSDINEIVSIFRSDACLRRVEMGSMEYIRQDCELSKEQTQNVGRVQALLKNLGAVLVTGFKSEDGNFNVSILLSRKGIAVSGSGLTLEYWEKLESPWTKMLECGEMEKLSDEHWYIHKLQDGPSCY